MFIGDGAKLVRDCFALAKEKAPSIIFIDELDAVGTKRFDSEKSGDREVQRTMLELLNQLDGFASDDRVKVLAATNRVDVLDPALLRSGRLDRKIEFPLPNEEARAQILRIHSRKMTVDDAVNWPELARSTDEFGGAQLKAVCVEAGMIALRSGQSKISHEHYVDAISEVQAKKKVCIHAATLGATRLTILRKQLISMHRHSECVDAAFRGICSILAIVYTTNRYLVYAEGNPMQESQLLPGTSAVEPDYCKAERGNQDRPHLPHFLNFMSAFRSGKSSSHVW